MALVYQVNKKTGITNVYENEPYWDKEKQQSRAKRTLVGKLSESSEIMPTSAYKKKAELVSDAASKRCPVPITEVRRSFFGASYLIDQIEKMTGITQDLKTCFPDKYIQMLSVAYYLILEENNALSRFSDWQRLHIHPFGEDLPSQRSSKLFQSIDEENRMAFLKNKVSFASNRNTGLSKSRPFQNILRRCAR